MSSRFAFPADPTIGPPSGSDSARAARRRAALLALAAAGGVAPVALAPVQRAAAQQAPAAQGVITGVVVTEAGQRPLGDAQVLVEGTQIGAATDASGRFRLSGVSGTQVRLVVRRIGFRPATVTARVGATDLRIAMSERATELSEIVVTGTAGVAEKRAIGNAVTTVRAADIVATQPVQNFQELLTGRASGVSIIASSGQVGTGSRIRVRGASSLSLNNDPLIYVDGVRVDNTQASGPSTQGFESRSISRWNDFNPEDIESIEVIKGPAAATLYGTEASNGVIQIITKKGASGRAVWNLSYRNGQSWIPDWRDRFFTNYGPVPRAGAAAASGSPCAATACDTVSITTRQLNDSLRRAYGRDIFNAGQLHDAQASVSGGTNTTKYYVSLGREENQGVEPDNRLHRTNVRANVNAQPNEKFDVSTSLGYTTGRTRLPFESGGGGMTWGTFFSSPSFLYGGLPGQPANVAGNPQLGFRSGPPDIYYAAYENWQDADRFTGSVTLTHRPFKALNHRLVVGLDRLAEDNQALAPRNDAIGGTFAAFNGLTAPNAGSMTVSTRDVNYVSADYLLNADFNLTSSWRSVSSAGGQFYGRRSRARTASATTFPSAGLTSLASAAVRTIDNDDVFQNNTVGAFVQQQVVYGDRLFLTAAIRADDNSAFGTNFDVVTYPKLSASYVLSEERAIPLPALVNQLRVRAAFGAAGLQPGTFDAIRTYGASGGFLTPSSAGNLDLGPERSTELELGLDFGLFNDRFTGELTYFDGSTRDAILTRQAPPSSGFPGTQSFNAGRVDRNGFEWLLRAQPINRQNFALDLTLNGSTNGYTVRDLGGSQLVSVTSNVAHVVGHAPGAWFDRRVVSATYNPTTRRTSSLLCDDGRGGTIACAQAPRVFLGNSVPTTEGSFGAGATFLRNWRVNALLDWRGGYSKLDGNLRTRCGAFTLCRELYYPDEVVARGDTAFLAAAQAGLVYSSHLIQSADFARFRELSLTYTLPASLARRVRSSRASITVAGRNLALWTDFGGVEPEASFNGGGRGGQFGQWEQNVLPQPRQFVTTFNFSF